MSKIKNIKIKESIFDLQKKSKKEQIKRSPKLKSCKYNEQIAKTGKTSVKRKSFDVFKGIEKNSNLIAKFRNFKCTHQKTLRESSVTLVQDIFLT